ncbi:MAG: PAS domain S-box protein, partial [Chloroflexota bacterium]
MSRQQQAVTKADLAQELHRYRAAFEWSALALTLVDGELTILRANEHAADVLGLSRSEIEGKKRWDEFIPFEDARRLVTALDGKAAAGKPVRFRTLLHRASGESRQVVIEAAAVPADGSLIVSLFDAEGRQDLDAGAGYHRDVFRSLFINSPEGIVLIDSAGMVIDANPAFVDMFGYSREELVGKVLLDLIVPDVLREKARATVRKTVTGGAVIDATTRVRADGREITVSFVGAPVLVEGRAEAAFGIYRDITERHHLQDWLADAFIDLVETTARLMGSMDPYTAGHQRRVARLADMVGRRLGLDDDTLQGIYVGAMLHDIGKFSIPSTILTKPGRLSKQEWNIIRTHPMRGYAILAEASLPWPVADMALQHHERLDGSGYPHGIGADALGIEVRILAACDVVEAMSSNRPYRPALPMEETRKEILDGSGTKFDPDVAAAIVELIDEGNILPSDTYEGM